MPTNTALWLRRPGGPFEVAEAPYTAPGVHEVVVRARGVAVNTIDMAPGLGRRLILPWLKYPTVVGSDVAGEIVEVGAQVTRFKVGDRVLGHATGIARDRNSSAEGAFQTYVVLLDHMTSPIPDELAFESASVLPLALSTAATGLFQKDHLGLDLPQAGAHAKHQTVVVWGGSTTVGSNGIQLARNAGYRVLTTASPRNFDYVRSLGAELAVDYHEKDAAEKLIAAIGTSQLVGVLANGSGSLKPAIEIARRTDGTKLVAASLPALFVRLSQRTARRSGVQLTAIWGGSLKNNEVGPAIYADFLPTALANGAYTAAPEPIVAGEGLSQIPKAMQRLKAGVSAGKVVVTI